MPEFSVKIVQQNSVYKYVWTLLEDGKPAKRPAVSSRLYSEATVRYEPVTGHADTVVGARWQAYWAKRSYLRAIKNFENHRGEREMKLPGPPRIIVRLSNLGRKR